MYISFEAIEKFILVSNECGHEPAYILNQVLTYVQGVERGDILHDNCILLIDGTKEIK